MTKPEFDVFLSHNSKDKPAVRRLAEALQERGLKVWLDEWQLVPGRPWQAALEEIIATTKSAAVLVGKDGLGPWEEPEMRACLSQFVKREMPVIPVLLPGASKQPELPLLLQGFTWVDLRSGLKQEELDRIVWGITGKRPVTPSRPVPARRVAAGLRRIGIYLLLLLVFSFLVWQGVILFLGPNGEPGTKPAHEPAMLVAPFSQGEVGRAQQDWSRTLGTDVTIRNSIGMKLQLIPPGEFLMGSPQSEVERSDEEHQHRVRITKPFYLGVYEVTQAEYERVMNENPSSFSPEGESRKAVSGLDTSRLPVESITYDEAIKFCEELSARPAEQDAGRVYRLPTEPEWEYACRAGTTRPLHFGSQLKGGEANCNGTSPYGTVETGPYLKRTTMVGSYAPNAFGLYDMHGNVIEWCRDWYDEDYYKESPVDDPHGPSAGLYRVIRGGSWDCYSAGCRSAYRRGYEPANRSRILGFRVAAVPSGK